MHARRGIPRCAATKTLRQKKGGGTELPYADSGVSLKEAVRRSQLRFTLFELEEGIALVRGLIPLNSYWVGSSFLVSWTVNPSCARRLV
jgi:hypothetical protein